MHRSIGAREMYEGRKADRGRRVYQEYIGHCIRRYGYVMHLVTDFAVLMITMMQLEQILCVYHFHTAVSMEPLIASCISIWTDRCGTLDIFPGHDALS